MFFFIAIPEHAVVHEVSYYIILKLVICQSLIPHM